MVKVNIGNNNIGRFFLWFIIIISFTMTVVSLLLSGPLQTRTVFDENVSNLVMASIASQLTTNYGLINKTNNFIPNVKSIQFTNMVSMETDTPCVFRFNVQDCGTNCDLKTFRNAYFKEHSQDTFSMQASGTKTDSFIFPVADNQTFIIKDDNEKSVAAWYYP